MSVKINVCGETITLPAGATYQFQEGGVLHIQHGHPDFSAFYYSPLVWSWVDDS